MNQFRFFAAVAAFLAAMFASQSLYATEGCRIQPTIGLSFSLFPKHSVGGEAASSGEGKAMYKSSTVDTAEHDAALEFVPLYDGDIGIELECHLTKEITFVAELALGMNSKPQFQMPLTLGVFRAVNKHVAIGGGAALVFHPDDRVTPFGGGLTGPAFQFGHLPHLPWLELALILGPAIELVPVPGQGPAVVPGFSTFVGFALR